MEVKSGRMFEKEILPFMEEMIMKKLRTYNIYSVKEYEDIRKAVRYSIRFCKKHKIVRCEDKNLNKETFGRFGEISTNNSKIRVFVVPTDEEDKIARDTFELVGE